MSKHRPTCIPCGINFGTNLINWEIPYNLQTFWRSYLLSYIPRYFNSFKSRLRQSVNKLYFNISGNWNRFILKTISRSNFNNSYILWEIVLFSTLENIWLSFEMSIGEKIFVSWLIIWFSSVNVCISIPLASTTLQHSSKF